MSKPLPKKLKSDAITEAICEIRFDSDPSLVSEILIGRLADRDEWLEYPQTRLATADIPAPIRRTDPNLKYQASVDLLSPDNTVTIRIGPQMIAYSRKVIYPGWDEFGKELESVIDHLFKVVPKTNVNRIGLRYVNVMKSDTHGISGVNDLDISITVAGAELSDSFNLNFKSVVDHDIQAVSRIASIDMAQGSIPDKATVVIDIDVFTEDGHSSNNPESVKAWVTRAHEVEKQQFFRVLGEDATDRLRED